MPFSRRFFGKAFVPGGTLVGREASPSLEGKAGSDPTPSTRSHSSRVLVASYTMKRRGRHGLQTSAPFFTFWKDELRRTP
jgi:hypothetical protein